MPDQKIARPPRPCRKCDHRRDDRCSRYDVLCKSAQRGFDIPECCYGRHVDGEPSFVWSKYEDD